MQITIACFSEVLCNDRLDSKFFLPEYVESYNILSKTSTDILSECSHVTDGNHLKIAENYDEQYGVRYLRGQDLGANMLLTDRNIVYIPEDSFLELERSHIFPNDILVTIVGANTGLVGLVFNPPSKLVANCKLGIVRANRNKIGAGYLYAFLTGRFGQHQIMRSIRGGGQTGLILPDLRNMKIARLDKSFEGNICETIYQGHRLIIKAENMLLRSQLLLIEELGLLSWQSKNQLCFVKNYSDVATAERFDADYFQPKYAEIEQTIKNYAGDWDILGNLVSMRKCVEVGSGAYQEEGIPFVRVSNLTPFELTQEKMISEELYQKLKMHQPKQGEILFSKDGTPGIAHHLRDKPQRFIPSGGILRLKNKSPKMVTSKSL